ncbi:MAG: SurA N-terminal domain-containing protein, partial [Chthoniobacterales bacterium]|nr:SurA N-terminal domain-containing protein [Chthoniobacterales bacterium]
MIRPLCIAIFAAGALLLATPDRALVAAEPIEPQVVDGIAATVNGDVITFSQVRGLTAPRERLLRQQLRGAELEKQIKTVREGALKDLIDRQLIIQSFRKEKLGLPDYFVEQRTNDVIRENFGG